MPPQLGLLLAPLGQPALPGHQEGAGSALAGARAAVARHEPDIANKFCQKVFFLTGQESDIAS